MAKAIFQRFLPEEEHHCLYIASIHSQKEQRFWVIKGLQPSSDGRQPTSFLLLDATSSFQNRPWFVSGPSAMGV